MRKITNEEFNRAWNNQEYQKIISKASYPYKIPPMELQSCKMMGLWEALKGYNKKSKFSTFLFNQIRFQCLKWIKKFSKEIILPYVDSSVNPETIFLDIEDVLKYLDMESQILIQERFIQGKTLRELGIVYGVSHETIRKRLKKITFYLKKCDLVI